VAVEGGREDIGGDQGRAEAGGGQGGGGCRLLDVDCGSRLEAGFRAGLVQYVGQSVARRVVHPAAVGQVAEADARPFRGGVVGGDDHDQLLLAQDLSGARPVRRGRTDREIGLTCAHGISQLVGVPMLEEPDADLRVAPAPSLQRGREDAEADRVQRRDLQLTHLQPSCLARGAVGPFGVGESGPSVREHRAAGRGQSYCAREALQQRAARGSLERADLVGEGRLGDVQELGRLGERAQVDDGDQIFELSQRRHERSLWEE
jgi:hypothetical protein